MHSIQQQIAREISKYSMRGDWRAKDDKEILEKIATICNNAKFDCKFIENEVFEWIHSALCHHKDALKYSSPLEPRLYEVAEKAVRNICNRLF